MSARAALASLAARDGFVTPSTVLDEARDPDSALHPHFVWDDTEAAERYRLVQAQGLIRRYKITVVTAAEQTVRVRAYTSLPSEDGPAYMDTREAMSQPGSRELIMQQAMRDIAALRAKYQALLDFDEVLRASIGRKVGRRRKAS